MPTATVARGRVRVVLAGLLVLLLAALHWPQPASAVSSPAAENRIWAKPAGSITSTRAEAAVLAGQRLGETRSRSLVVVATGVAANTADDAARLVGAACSFSGDTRVVMADGSTKPISEIEVGDEVLATDPETGEQGPREVTHVWVHEDTVVDLEVDGQIITTTEDHPFWDATAEQWQRADQLDQGDQLLTADRRSARVGGFIQGSERRTIAFNLTVEGIHTYHVTTTGLLVHNQCTPLRLLHGEDTIKISNRSSYDHWTQQSTDDIVASLRPGATEPLTVTAEGTIMQGNTRVYVLMQRGFDVNTLPRTPYQPGPLPDAFG